MGFRLTGIKEGKARLRRIEQVTPRALGDALFKEGEFIMTKSQQVVPVDRGTLRGSGHVRPPEIKGTIARVILGYGGAASDYAVAVHETPSIYDPPTWQGTPPTFRTGGPKFLEKPVKEEAPRLGRILAARVFKEWRKL